MFIFMISAYANLDAQNSTYTIWKYSSPLYLHMDDIYKNPSQLHILPLDRNTSIALNNVYFTSNGETPYNIYEGYRYNYSDILAKGYRKNKNGSTVYGFGMLKKDYNVDVVFNSIANYKKFYPYVVGVDSQNNIYKESYSIGGSYSHKFGNFYIGAYASYLGGILYGVSDPRAENRFSEMDMRVGFSYDFGNYNIGVFLSYMKYKENIDMVIKKTGIKKFFYSMIGLGLYDYQYSQLSESFSRFIKNDGLSLGISLYRNDMNGFFSNIYMNLNNSKNIEPNERIPSEKNEISGSIKTGYIFNWKRNNFKVYNNIDYQYSVGVENFYTKYYVHKNPDIIDYAFFKSRKNEAIIQFSNRLSFVYQYRLNDNNHLEVVNDSSIEKYKELYEKYFVNYLCVNNELSLGYRFAFRNNFLSTYMSYGYRQNIQSHIEMPEYENNIIKTYMMNYFKFMYRTTECIGAKMQYIRPIYKDISLAIRVGYLRNYGSINYDKIETQLTFIF